MKARKIVLAVLLSVLMVASALLVVACNKEVKIDLRKASAWSNDRDETSYNVSESNGKMVVAYQTSGQYQYIKRTLIEEPEELAKVKTLVFKASVVSETSDHPVVTLKFEGRKDGVNPEIKFEVGSTEKTYEWDVSELLTSGENVSSTFLIFMEGDLFAAKGTLTVSELYFTSNEINKANEIVPYTPPQVDVDEIVWNEITASKKSVTDWTADANGVYKVQKDGTSTNVSVDKDAFKGDDAYVAVVAYIYGDALKDMKSFKITIDGPADTQLYIKPFDQNGEWEFKVKLTGEPKEFAFDVSGLTERKDIDYSKKEDLTGDLSQNKVAILALPGATEGKVDFVIKSAEFSTDVVENKPSDGANEITATNHKITKGWAPLDPGVYTVVQNGTSFDVTFDKPETYRFLATTVVGEEIAKLNTVKLTVKGEAGKQVLFKFLGIEERVDLTGDEDEVEIYYADKIPGTDFTKEQQVLIVGNSQDDQPRTGQFTIVSVEFYKGEEVVDPNLNEITNSNTKITKGWRPLDAGTTQYVVTPNAENPEIFDVTFDKPEQYKFLVTEVRGADIANFNGLKFVVKGEAGQEVMGKFCNLEVRCVLTGGNDEFVVDYRAKKATTNFEMKQQVLMVGNSSNDSPLTGSFSIVSVEFVVDLPTTEAPEASEITYNGDLKVTIDSWANCGEHITFAKRGSNWVAKYTAQRDEYGAAKATVKLGDQEVNYAVFEVLGTKGSHAIFKFGGFEYKFDDGTDSTNAHFADPFTGEWQTVVIKLETPVKGDQDVLLMAGFKENDIAGEVEIRRAELYYVANTVDDQHLDVNNGWLNAVKGSTRNTITTENGKTTITYSNYSWDSVLMWIDLGNGGYDKLTLKFKGLADHTAIISVNGAETKYEGNNGDKGRLSGSEQTIEADVSGLSGIVFVRIFLDMNEIEGVNENGGSFEITQALFSKAA